jgi:hypothetical protein
MGNMAAAGQARLNEEQEHEEEREIGTWGHGDIGT